MFWPSHLSVRPEGASRLNPLRQYGGGVLYKSLGRSLLEAPFILAECLLRWAQLNLCSLRATHVLGKLNLGADMLSRSNAPSDEWTLQPQTVQEIWGIFGRPEVDLFASEDTHCQTYFSKDRDALAHDWPNLLLYTFPPITLIPQVIRRIREQKHRLLLVAPLWRNQHWFAKLSQLLTSAPWSIPLLSQANRTIWYPQPELWALQRYIFGLSMGAFWHSRECAKYYFSG